MTQASNSQSWKTKHQGETCENDCIEIYTKSDNGAFQVHKPFAEIGAFSLIEDPLPQLWLDLESLMSRDVVQ